MRLLAVIVACACSLSCLTTGGTAVAAAAAKKGTLVVKVSSGAGPIAGATVTIGDLSQLTNSAGNAAFTLTLRQTYAVNVSAQWYVPWSTSVWFQKSQTVTASLQSAIVIPKAVLIVPSAPVNK